MERASPDRELMSDSVDDSRRVLVFHQNALLVDVITLTLNHGVFEVRSADSLAGLDALPSGWRPGLAMVDMEHDESLEVLSRFIPPGSTRAQVPVLGLTRRGDLTSKLRAFDLGVDDIMTVPFSPEELLARSLVITRRATGTQRPLVPAIVLGEMRIDITRREVRAGNSVVHLTSLEQSLLYVLASRPGRTFTREEIIDAVWGADFLAESNVVDRHIRSLRIKLQNDYRKPRFIATVPGTGYRFIPTFTGIEWIEGAEGAAVATA
jgi:DNA-binding response OmpR family regulator